MASIESFMTPKTVSARPEETVDRVCQRMRDAEVGCVLVLEGETLVGLFSERDLLNRVVGTGLDPSATPVGEVATRELVTVSTDTPLRRCAEALQAHKLRHLPVVAGGRPVGIVSARDFFETVAGELAGLVERVRYEEELRADVDPYDHIGGGYGR